MEPCLFHLARQLDLKTTAVRSCSPTIFIVEITLHFTNLVWTSVAKISLEAGTISAARMNISPYKKALMVTLTQASL